MSFNHTMAEVLPLLPIAQPEYGRGSYNIRCPHCDSHKTKDRDGHLNINLVKNVFCCPKCNFKGGILDLYSYFADVPREYAKRDLEARLDTGQRIGSNNKKPTNSQPVIKEYPLTDIDTRSATYQALISKLSLASDHLGNLLNRGLKEVTIAEKQYRTTPVVGAKVIAKQLLEEGYYLSGVPGFYRDTDGQWTFVTDKRGILVPMRDITGRIQGLQIRRDNVKRRKFRWVSSSERLDGCRAESWCHLAGPIREKILLIEGPLKADVVNYHTGQTVLAVAGVNALAHLELMLKKLKNLGVKHIMTCFDMDYLKNPHAYEAYFKMLKMLSNNGFTFGTYLWHPEYNGLDDYVWEYCLWRQHVVA